MTRLRPAFVLAFAVLVGPPPSRAHAGGQMPLPKPGPEHEIFKMDEGTWDATIETTAAPGAPATTTKGVEVNTVGCGGLCLITDFKGELMPGMTFHGHGVVAWDVVKKKYAGGWTDSLSQGLALSESTWDPAAKKMSGILEGPDTTGRVVRSRSVSEHRDDGTRVFTMYSSGPDGKEKEAEMIRITYRKRM